MPEPRPVDVARRVQLLRVVLASDEPLAFSALARRAGVPGSIASRLLSTLVDRGFVCRDERGRYAAGWVLHGAAHPHQTTVEHAELALEEEFAEFLTARLLEEADVGRRRVSAEPEDAERIERGLSVLAGLVADLAAGRLPDDVTLQLLTSAYAGHPEYRDAWGSPAAVVAERVGHPR